MITENVTDALTAATNSSGNNKLVVVLNDQGGGVINISEGNVSPTLRAETHQHEPIICMATQQGGAEIMSDKAPTLTASAGMSGNNQPVICFDPKAISDGKCATSIMGENAKDNPCVCYVKSSFGGYKEGTGTLKASGGDIGGVRDVVTL